MDDLKKLLATPRGRVMAIVLVAVVIGGIGFAALTLTSSTSNASSAPPRPLRHIRHTTKHASAHKTVHAAKLAHPKKAKPKPPTISDKLPPALGAALLDHDVVVVSIYAPRSPDVAGSAPTLLDQQALLEARAGAKDAGAGFVAVNMSSETQIRALSSVLTITVDPELAIFDRNGTILYQQTGFLDRLTVARAAEDAIAGDVKVPDAPPPTGPADGYWKALADRALCTENGQLEPLPSAPTQLESYKLAIAAGQTTLAQLRAVPAVGKDAPRFAAMLAQYGATVNDLAALRAALAKTDTKAFNAAGVRMSNDANAWHASQAAVGIDCFTDQKQ